MNFRAAPWPGRCHEQAAAGLIGGPWTRIRRRGPIRDQAAAQRRREAWARTQAELAKLQPTYVARRDKAVEEQRREDELFAGNAHQVLALVQQHRAAAQREVDRIAGLLGRARDLAHSIGREAVHAELLVAEAQQAAVIEFILGLAEGDNVTSRGCRRSGHPRRG
jgi:hypothetical protein